MRKFTEDGLKRYNAEIVLVIIDYKVMWLHALGQQENVLHICVFGEDKTEGLIIAKRKILAEYAVPVDAKTETEQKNKNAHWREENESFLGFAFGDEEI